MREPREILRCFANNARTLVYTHITEEARAEKWLELNKQALGEIEEWYKWMNPATQFSRCEWQQEEIASLEAEVERLKKGECEHVAKDMLVAGCRLCDMAVAEKGYPIWIKKAKDLEKQLARVNEEEIIQTICKHTPCNECCDETVECIPRLSSKAIVKMVKGEEG